MTNLREAGLPLTNIEALQNILNDRTWSHEFMNELNDQRSTIENYIKTLRRETIDRTQLINILEVATSYYQEQNDKFLTVAQAYFSYTKRVELLKSKLESLVGSIPTDNPMPSNYMNSPTPSTSSVPIEELNTHYINNDTVSNSDKNMMTFSMDNSINDTDIYVPTTVVNNIKSYSTPHKTVKGKRRYNKNLNMQTKNKRKNTTTSSTFVQTKSAFNGLCKEY